MSELEIAYIATTDLIPYANNPRTHSDQQVSQVASSIKEFGFNNPILIDEHNGIIAGHGRLAAAQKLDLKLVPTITLAGLSEAQRKAYVIADNKLTENGGWDYDLLAVEIERLKELDVDIDLTGFDPTELDAILEPEVVEGLTDEDEVPEAPDEPVTKRGDVWILGNHRLMCGDSTSIDDMDKLMAGQKADMVFTDPPYNINYGNIKHAKFKVREIENDNMSLEEFRDFCAAFTSCIKIYCSGCVYVFGPPGVDGRAMFGELDKQLHCSTTIVWNKDVFTLGRGKYQNKYEPCWFGWNESGASFVNERNLTNVWDFKRPKSSKLHPTMKPVELVEQAISHASNVGGRVMDLFGGSGTTMIASEKVSRECRMMELDPKYCDVIVDRWQSFTGKTAQLERPLEVANG